MTDLRAIVSNDAVEGDVIATLAMNLIFRSSFAAASKISRYPKYASLAWPAQRASAAFVNSPWSSSIAGGKADSHSAEK